MKLIKYLLFLLILLIECCASVDKYNAQLNTLRSEKDLKTDVDYIHHKLEKLHPDLYHYISKKELDFKFDSLKSTLTSPLTSNDFYFKLSPVIASIKQGHTQTFPLTKKLKYLEKKSILTNGSSPLALFDFEIFDNKLYIVKNNSKDSTIKAGTEMLTINGVKPMEIITKFSHTFTSDGYNKTFVSRRLANGFPRFYYYQNGIVDSVLCQLNYKDTIRTITLKRPIKLKMAEVKKTMAVVKKPKELVDKDKALQKKESQKRKLQGYDPFKRKYSKELRFPTKDSSIAIMKISDFVKGSYKKFYKRSFQQLDSVHTKTLIIDLRDNPGGRLAEINTLYSHLSDSSFHFIDRAEVTSKTSLWHFGYFNNEPLWTQAILSVFFPFVIGGDIYTFLKTTKGIDNKYYFPIKQSKLTLVKANRFKGKVYVLINGGCFSASSVLSSNLKGSKRAVFVGEETGGADNGCVAGIMPILTLPKSKLTVRFGLMGIQTHYKSMLEGRGIFPDKEITPILKDRIIGNDPELVWILDIIKGLKRD